MLLFSYLLVSFDSCARMHFVQLCCLGGGGGKRGGIFFFFFFFFFWGGGSWQEMLLSHECAAPVAIIDIMKVKWNKS